MGGLKLRRAVDIRPGEGRIALLTGATLALIIAAHTVVETARDALFLSKLPPERLTFVYALLAVLSLVVGAGSASLASRFGRRAALVFSLMACAYGAVLLYLRPVTETSVFVLYLGSGVVGTVLPLQFWMMAGQLFTVSQGKRLFGPIAAGGVLGAAVGGGAAALALRFVSTGSLLVLAAGVFVAAGLIVATSPSGEAADQTGGSTSAFGWVRDFSVLRNERYVWLVAALTVFGTATVLVADYLFKSTAAAYYPSAQLGSFFALFYAGQNAVALIVQIFVTGAVMRRLGVTGALLVLPVLLAFSGTLAGLGGGFVVAFAAKGADGSLRHSLHRVSSELLLLPLPSEVRDKAKPLIDTVFGRGTQAVVAGAILGLATMGLAGTRHLGITMGALGLCWMVAAVVIRKPYVDLFRKALARGELPGGAEVDDLDIASVETVMEALSSRDEDRVLAGIEVLADSGRSRVLPALILYHDSPRVLERALAVVATPERRDWVELAERLVDHADAAVRAAALRALAAAGHDVAVTRGLEDESPAVRASAAFFLARKSVDGDLMEDPHIAALLEQSGPDGTNARAALLGVIGEHGDRRWLPVVEAVVARDGERRTVAPVAALAIEKTGDTRFLAYLVSHLGVRDGRAVVRDAIVSMGDAAIPVLRAGLEDPATPERVKLEIPKTIASFRSQEVVDYLAGRLSKEPSGAIRFKILRALGTLAARGAAPKGERLRFDREQFENEAHKNLVEHFRLRGVAVALSRSSDGRSAADTDVGKALLSLLGDKIHQSLERAFRALQIAHRNEDLLGVHHAVQRGDRRARGNALEFLDALPVSSRGTRELLKLTADDLDPTETLRRAQQGASDADAARLDVPRAHDEAVRVLLAETDELVAALTAYHALDLGSIGLARDALGALDARPALGRLGGAPTRSRRESANG